MAENRTAICQFSTKFNFFTPSDLMEAIQLHASPARGRHQASEANLVIRRFNDLPVSQQQNVLDFLRSL